MRGATYVARLAILAMAGTAHGAPEPLALAGGEVAATVTTELDARTLALATDAWVGLGRGFTVGATHSNASLDRIGAGASPYGLDVRWLVCDGELAMAVRARLLVRDLDRWQPSATIGALVRWTRGRFAIASDPYVRAPLVEASADRGALVLPVWIEARATSRLAVAVHSGWGRSLASMPDGWHVPFALVARARLTDTIEVAVEAGFTSMLGPSDRMAERVVAIAIGWRDRSF